MFILKINLNSHKYFSFVLNITFLTKSNISIRNKKIHHWLQLLKSQSMLYYFRSVNTGFIKGLSQFCHSARTMTHKVFVYGTLKRNEPNHYWLTDPNNGIGTFVSEGKTKTKYPLIIGTKYNIPFLLHSPGNGHHVIGEIYDVDDAMLSKLDILEDHPNYYVREVDNIIVTESGSSQTKTVQCWVYFLKDFRPELLSKQQFEKYSSSGEHGLIYLERSKRDPNDDYFPQIKR